MNTWKGEEWMKCVYFLPNPFEEERTQVGSFLESGAGRVIVTLEVMPVTIFNDLD